jgi:2'-hydroxyisoflavone reductase
VDPRRRKLIQAGLLGGAAVTAGAVPRTFGAEAPSEAPSEALSILILGGTGFIGPHMVQEALRRGHSVTLFNRGRTNSTLFPDLELLKGDRNNGLGALQGGRWDVVIDNSGYVPRHVADSARLLSSAASHYLYVSTISVYANFAEPIDEDAELATLEDESVEEITNETYGPLKALCEQRAAAEFGADRLTVLRPTYICGPGDHTDRYTYWPVRTMAGGDMLWPGRPADPLQIIDVRDLANFTIDCVERRVAGIFNTVTPAGEFTIGRLMEDSLAVTAADTNPVWVDYDFISRHGLDESGELTIWVSPHSEYAKIALVDGSRATAQGLRNRPTRETARDTVAWWRTLPEDRTRDKRAGLTAARESELLSMWNKRRLFDDFQLTVI